MSRMATASEICVVCKNSVSSRIAGHCNQGGCNFKCSLKNKNHWTWHFCINLKYEMPYLVCKSIAEPEKGENNEIWEGKVCTYGIVPAEMGP